MDSYPEIPGAPHAPLSVRDWLAGLALNGMLSAQSEYMGSFDGDRMQAAVAAYEYAEAMMEARK